MKVKFVNQTQLKRIRKRFRNYLDDQGLTQKEFGVLINRKPPVISATLRGKRTSNPCLQAILEVINK